MSSFPLAQAGHGSDLLRARARSSRPEPESDSCPSCHPVLLLSGASVYANNIRATLQILPTLESERAIDNYLTKEALLTLASSNLIIAVSLAADYGILRCTSCYNISAED